MSKPRVLPGWLFWGVPLFAVGAFLLVLGAYVLTFPGSLLEDHEKWGQFGDYVGGILNPIFGFLALIALLATLALQSRELSISTQELAKSAQALILQNEVLNRQSFENTFFQLLSRFVNVVSNVRYDGQEGRGALSYLYQEKLRRLGFGRRREEDVAERAVFAYQEFYQEHRYELGHYFRTLYHIFRFIRDSALSEDEKCTYANVARAQLSSLELCLLFYNGIYGEGLEGFRPLIEEYGILKHVNPVDLLHPSHIDNRDFYADTAFMSYDERMATRAPNR